MPRIVCVRVSSLEARVAGGRRRRCSDRSRARGAARASARARRRSARSSAGCFPFHGATTIEEGNVYSMGWCVLDVETAGDGALRVRCARAHARGAVRDRAGAAFRRSTWRTSEPASGSSSRRAWSSAATISSSTTAPPTCRSAARASDKRALVASLEQAIAHEPLSFRAKRRGAKARNRHRPGARLCRRGWRFLTSLGDIALCVACDRQPPAAASEPPAPPLGISPRPPAAPRARRRRERPPGARRRALRRGARLPAHRLAGARRLRGHRQRRRRGARGRRLSARLRDERRHPRSATRRSACSRSSSAMEQGDGEFVNFIDARGPPEPRRAEQREEHVVLGGAQHLGARRSRARARPRHGPLTAGLRPVSTAPWRAWRARSTPAASSADRRPRQPRRCSACSRCSAPSPRPRAQRSRRARRSCSCRSPAESATRRAVGRARRSRRTRPGTRGERDRPRRSRRAAVVLERPDLVGCRAARSGRAVGALPARRTGRRRRRAGRRGEVVSADRVRRRPDRRGVPRARRRDQRAPLRRVRRADGGVVSRREPRRRRRCTTRRPAARSTASSGQSAAPNGCQPQRGRRVHDRVAARAAARDAQSGSGGVSALPPVGERAASLADVPRARDTPGRAASASRSSSTRQAPRFASCRVRGGPITLTYWPAANPDETRLATRLTERWNAEHPDVQVRVQPLPAGRSTEEVLLAAIVAKATPDVCSNVSSALLARLVRAGGVVRLDDRAATAARLRERTTAAMLASLRLPDGGIYAFPWKTNPEMLMYNVDLLARGRRRAAAHAHASCSTRCAGSRATPTATGASTAGRCGRRSRRRGSSASTTSIRSTSPAPAAARS